MLKRLFDITVSLIGLVLLLPVLAVIAAAVKLTSPGPVFYRATRVGRHGKLFGMYKFRTMADGPAGEGPRVTAQDDPRITRMGRLLRDTKLNELPQILNVLSGDMSLVGPRPEDPQFVAHYTDEERQVLTVRPGITSPASILYCDEEKMLSFETAAEAYLRTILPTKLRLDLLYVRRHSLLLDIDVLVRTALALLPAWRHAAPEAAEIFFGPVQQIVRRDVPWFFLDWFTALAGVGVVGILWRLDRPLNLGVGVSLLTALALAATFSAMNYVFGLQHTVWRYAGSRELLEVAGATCVSVALVVAADMLVIQPPPLPPEMLLTAGCFVLAGFALTRFGGRAGSVLAGQILHRLPADGRERVLVVGGGDTGQSMVWLLQDSIYARALRVVGIVDDELEKRGCRIHGVRVLGDRTQIARLVHDFEIDLIVFAIHNITIGERQAILALCRATPARVVVAPDVPAMLLEVVRPGTLADPLADEGINALRELSLPLAMVDAALAELADLIAAGRPDEAARRIAEIRARLVALQGPAQPEASRATARPRFLSWISDWRATGSPTIRNGGRLQ